VAGDGFEVEFMSELLRQLLTDELLSDTKFDTWSQVAIAIRAAAKLLPPASAVLRVPTTATLRGLHICGAAADRTSGAWFEAATIRMGVDAEHSSAVLSVLELLVGPEGHPGRFHVVNRNDPAAMCASMLGEIMRTADGIANLNNTLQTRSAAVQAARIIVAMRSTMSPPPMCVLPEATQSGGFEYLSMVSYKGAEIFAAQFTVGWRAYSAFSTALPGATDVQARTYIAGWLAAAKLGAVDEVSVTGLHAVVAEVLPALKSLTSVTLSGYAAEIGRVIAGGRRADKDGYTDPPALSCKLQDTNS
jgi:hypothetical protein